jgi:hypothetical protein
MLPFTSQHSPALAIILLVALPALSSADNPQATSGQAQKTTVRPPAVSKTQADIEYEAKIAELERRKAKAAGDAALATAIAEDHLKNMDPRILNLIDPVVTAAQHELVEECLKAHPTQLLDVVDKALLDGIVRLSELAVVEHHWGMSAKPKAKARTVALLQGLRDFPRSAPDKADSKSSAASFEGDGSIELAIATGKLPSEAERQMGGLRAELVKAAIHGQALTAAERAKLESLFGVKREALATLESSLQREARAAEHEEIERHLRAHPVELRKHVENAYQDDKVTKLEYEVVKAVKEEIEIRECKKRIKALIQEVRNGNR